MVGQSCQLQWRSNPTLAGAHAKLEEFDEACEDIFKLSLRLVFTGDGVGVVVGVVRALPT